MPNEEKDGEIRLSKKDWWKELEQKGLPRELVMLLRGLIGSHLKHAILPEAKLQIIHPSRQVAKW